MTAANEPLQPTNNNRSNKTMAGGKTTMTFKPMSRLPLSAELEEYTQSMKTYLASVENRPNDRRPSDSEDSEPDRSPEFRWMDLNALQRKYSHQSMSTDGVRRVNSSSSSSPSSIIKPGHRNSGARQHLAFDSRHQRQHQHKLQHVDNRSASPSRNSSSSSTINKFHHLSLQPQVRVKVSAEKN